MAQKLLEAPKQQKALLQMGAILGMNSNEPEAIPGVHLLYGHHPCDWCLPQHKDRPLPTDP
eukprot:5774881-Prorocentrum_lima.AAC.1